ncbi:hypothetical protein OEA41_000840 [Lepraria neglecta]|uniref:DUF6594 domain-containing protein n=1 Tax=Lepraria neglecta TaxID=209136 RepID=A0AAD9ZIT0_9LECA|nr:hypothetical protein OEA41_000840 [Lepraria neglecta]
MAILPQHGYNAQTLSYQHKASSISTAAPLVQYPVKFKPTGYAQFADFISSDKELAVYCRFDRTAARILLVLQSRLLFKQQQLDLLDEEDAAARKDDEKFLSSATICEELRQPRSPRDEKRNQLYDELKDALKEYCT